MNKNSLYNYNFKTIKTLMSKDASKILKKKNKFIEINCPSCFDKSSKKLFLKKKFNFRECKKCKTIFISPRPTEELIKKYYYNSDSIKYWAETLYPQSEKNRIKLIYYPLIKILKKKIGIKKLIKSKLLDIGSGNGLFSKILIKNNIINKIECVEPSKILVKNYEKKQIVHNKMFSKVRFQNISFEIITAINVIEHVYSPKQFIKKIYNLLHQNGIFLLTTPNVKGFEILVNQKKSNAFENERLNYFNILSIKKLLEQNKFVIKYINTIGKLDINIILNQNINIKNNKWVEYIVKNCTEHTLNEFQKFLTNNLLSSHLLVIAQKKIS